MVTTRSQTGMNRGVNQLRRKFRTAVLFMVVLTFAAIFLIDKREESQNQTAPNSLRNPAVEAMADKTPTSGDIISHETPVPVRPIAERPIVVMPALDNVPAQRTTTPVMPVREIASPVREISVPKDSDSGKLSKKEDTRQSTGKLTKSENLLDKPHKAREKSHDDSSKPAKSKKNHKLDIPRDLPVCKKGHHVIAPGESLSTLASKYYGDAGLWLVIWRANEVVIKDPKKLKTGMEIVIPEDVQKLLGGNLKRENAKARHKVSNTGGDIQLAKSGERVYLVKAGDNLSKIAKTTGASLTMLIDLNKGIDERTLAPGDKVYLPKK